MATNNSINANQTLDTAATPTFGTLTLSSATAAQINATVTTSGAGAGPVYENYRNKSSTNADTLCEFRYDGQSSTGVQRVYAYHNSSIISNTNGSEKGQWILNTMSAGALVTQITALDTGCQVRGNNTNTAAPAGFIGELFTSAVTIGSPSSLSTGVAKTIQQLTLTPGLWDVWLQMGLFGATTKAAYIVGINTTTNSVSGLVEGDTSVSGNYPTGTLTNNWYPGLIQTTFSVAAGATVTVYGVAQSTFTVGTETAWGAMKARRVA